MSTESRRALRGSAADVEAERHIVEVLIRERAPTLLDSSLLGGLARSVLYPLLGYRDAVSLADLVAPLDGLATMDAVSAYLKIDVLCSGIQHLPKTGGAVVVANHPTGIADGIVVFDALSRVRRDLTIFANRDAIRAAPGLADLIVPVEYVQEKRTRTRSRETLAATVQAFRDERLIVLFPSGRLAHMQDGRLTERPWLPSAVSLARKYGVPVVPMHIDGRNSRLYYLFSRISDQLRDITLFHEVLNKRQSRYEVSFGPQVPTELLDGDLEALTAALQRHVESRLEVPLELDVPRT